MKTKIVLYLIDNAIEDELDAYKVGTKIEDKRAKMSGRNKRKYKKKNKTKHRRLSSYKYLNYLFECTQEIVLFRSISFYFSTTDLRLRSPLNVMK